MLTVAVIDADPAYRTAAEGVLRSAGYEVTTAADGVAGLELIRARRPFFVVLEILLPKLHGFALCQEIRNDPELRNRTRVIVTSSQSYPNDIKKALELGAVSFLVKPFQPERLADALSDASRRAPVPLNEVSRLAALHGCSILDTRPEPVFDDLTMVASVICGTPMAMISLVDEDRQWFKSKVGTDLTQTSRDIAFCAHAIMETDVFVVRDATQDERFHHNVLVTHEPKIRFYAGVPLRASTGEVLGTLCVVDTVPRDPTPIQLACLKALARQVQAHLEYRREIGELRKQVGESKLKESA